MLPPDNATGNYTKVVQRIPVKIALDDPEFAEQVAPGPLGDRNRPHEAISRHNVATATAHSPTTNTGADRTRNGAAIPSQISTRPLLGILGVLIGAGLVTLTGRMLSLGLADLKGHVGISYDAGCMA